MDPWKNLNSLSKNKLIELQNRKLQDFISHQVYPFSKYYSELFDNNNIDPSTIRSIKDLNKIPFTSKRDFYREERKDVFKDFVLTPDAEKIKNSWPKSRLFSMALKKAVKGNDYAMDLLAKEYRPVFMTFTTGTTNTPVPFVYTNYDLKNLHLSGSRMLNLFNINQQNYIVNMFPFAPHLAFWQVVFGGFESNTLILSTGGGKSIGTDGNIGALERMKPSVVLGVPSYVYHVLCVAKEKGVRLNYIKKVVLGASKVTVGFKKKLAELLHSMGAEDVCIFGTYGFTEARCAWAECPTSLDVSSGYHLYSDKEIFEVVDPETGEVKEEGQDGELVYTSLDSRASVMIRYRTGDYVKGGITYDPCPYCGRTTPRINSNITRLSNIKDLQLSKIKGALVNFNSFDSVLSDIASIDEWQIEIKKKDNDPYEVDQLFVYVCAKKGYNEQQLKNEISNKLRETCEVTPNGVIFTSMDELIKRLEIETANKEKRIIDRRPAD